MINVGRAQEALPLLEKALRLNPLPQTFYYLSFGHAFRSLRRFEEAISMYKKIVALNPNHFYAYLSLGVSYGMLGKEEEVKAAIAEVLRINPKFSIRYFAKTSTSKDKEQAIEILRKAGLPENPPKVNP